MGADKEKGRDGRGSGIVVRANYTEISTEED